MSFERILASEKNQCFTRLFLRHMLGHSYEPKKGRTRQENDNTIIKKHEKCNTPPLLNVRLKLLDLKNIIINHPFI